MMETNNPEKNNPPTPLYYVVPESPAFEVVIKRIDELKADIDAGKKANPDLWPTVLKKTKIRWTTDSNAIEGSSLSFSDTKFFLENGLTVEGKPFKDFVDALNHTEAIEFLLDVVKNKQPISEGLLKEINALLLKDITSTPAMNEYGQKAKKPAAPGRYKQQPNHVLQADGTMHHYVDPLHVFGEMQTLCRWIDEVTHKHHPAVVGAMAHYNFVRIHPFDDGNGRGARILMNLILMKAGYPPAVIPVEKRSSYLLALREADDGNMEPFLAFVTENLIETQKIMVNDLKR